MSRTRWIVAIALPIAVLVALPLIASAGSPPTAPSRHYRGTTSQDRRAALRTEHTSNGWALSDASFDLRLRCDDGTTLEPTVDFALGQPVVLDAHHRFAFDHMTLDEAVHIHGRLGPKKGSGWIEVTMAALTKDEQAQLCTTHRRDWTVKRVYTPTSPTPVPVAPSRPTIKMTVGADGTTRVTRSA